MNKKEHTYTLHLTKRQVEILSYACDRFSRLICGQDWTFQDLFEAAWEKRCKEAVGGNGSFPARATDAHRAASTQCAM